MIRIIGGIYKGTKLKVFEKNVRPTSAIKRKAIFSILESYALKLNYDLYKNKSFIDLFAGSGSFGLEAISRGLSFCSFFELNYAVTKILLINCKKICKKNQFNIQHTNSLSLKKINFPYPVSVIFIDPPYSLNPFHDLLDQFFDKNILNDNTIIVIETDKKTPIGSNKKFTIIREKIYGKSKIIFLKKN